MEWLDLVLLTGLCISVVIGIWRGFVREIISMASVAGALIVSGLGYRWAGGFFEDIARDSRVAGGIGFLVLFFTIVIVGVITSALLRRLIKFAGLDWFDRFMGGTFGALRGLLIGSVVLLALTAFDIKGNVIKNSLLAPYFLIGARAIVLVMPQDVKTKFKEGYESFRNALTDKK